jgi:hypothetical protein
MSIISPDKEICNECGKSVAQGSGRFVNRVPDFDDAETRIEMGRPFPEGGWMCEECDGKYSSAEHDCND